MICFGCRMCSYFFEVFILWDYNWHLYFMYGLKDDNEYLIHVCEIIQNPMLLCWTLCFVCSFNYKIYMSIISSNVNKYFRFLTKYVVTFKTNYRKHIETHFFTIFFQSLIHMLKLQVVQKCWSNVWILHSTELRIYKKKQGIIIIYSELSFDW